MKNPLDIFKRWLLDLVVPYIEGTNKKRMIKNETLPTWTAILNTIEIRSKLRGIKPSFLCHLIKAQRSSNTV